MIRLFQGENYGVGFILVSVGLVEDFNVSASVAAEAESS